MSAVKVGPTGTSANQPELKHELTATQIQILKKAAPFTISVKFSDLKFREGKRTFSFSTKIAKLPKLICEKRSSDTSDSYFEFTNGEIPNEDLDENQWKSPWVSKGQPATFVFQQVKRTQEELSNLFTIAGLEHFRSQDKATETLQSMQSFVDQLTSVQMLWTPELLNLLGIEDRLIVECLEKQRDHLIETNQATKLSKVRIAN